MKPQWIQSEHHKANYEQFGYVPGAIASGHFAFISGQVGVEANGSVHDDPETQIARAFANLGEVLKAIPASPRDIVDITTFHIGLRSHYELFSTAKKNFFGDWDPAWTAIGTTELGLEGLILEVRAIVCISSNS